MTVALVYPPAADPSQPYSSLPALCAFLRAKTRFAVHPFDLNIELCRKLLERESLERASKAIRKRLANPEPGPNADPEKQGRLVRAALTSPFVLEEIGEAVAELKRIDCYRSPERLDKAKRTVFDAFQILGANNDDLGFDSKTASKKRFGTPAEIAAAVDGADNPFAGFFAKNFMPRLLALSPKVVGISLTYHSQIVAAFTLAREIRRVLPQIILVLGGQVVSHWHATLEKTPELFESFDYLIAFEGETALRRLLEALQSGGSVAGIPNLVWREGGKITRNPVAAEAIDDLPTPDYEGLPLSDYLTPEPVFLLSASRGCYWGRCAFCSVSPSFRGRYRKRDPELVYKDIVTLAERHGARYLAFGDDCLDPRTLRYLARRLPAGQKISWQGELRFEKGLDDGLIAGLRKAGCVNLIFGLESYSERVLGLMDKGTSREEIDRVLGQCARNGIAYNLQFFFGFPGETEADAQTTADFILEQAEGKATFSYGLFNLVRGSRVETDPAGFSLERVDRDAGPLAVTYPYLPAPGYANRVKADLQTALIHRCRYPHLGLSLTAQSLIFLAETADIQTNLYGPAIDPYGPAIEKTPSVDDGDMMEARWRRGEWISAGRFPCPPEDLLSNEESRAESDGYVFAHDREKDKTVILSDVAFWLLQRLDGAKSARELIMSATGPDIEDLERKEIAAGVEKALRDLIEHGFVTRSNSTALWRT